MARLSFPELIILQMDINVWAFTRHE